MLDAVEPAESLSIELKTGEVDVTENGSRKLIFYTDGRSFQKSRDATVQLIAAHWNGTRLVSDEKGPEKGKLNRTFELSPNGRQFYETLRVETHKSRAPVVLQYVYDIFIPPNHETDPYQPVMRRRSHNSKSETQSPQPQPAAAPDPDQPIMKRRTDDSN